MSVCVSEREREIVRESESATVTSSLRAKVQRAACTSFLMQGFSPSFQYLKLQPLTATKIDRFSNN